MITFNIWFFYLDIDLYLYLDLYWYWCWMYVQVSFIFRFPTSSDLQNWDEDHPLIYETEFIDYRLLLVSRVNNVNLHHPMGCSCPKGPSKTVSPINAGSPGQLQQWRDLRADSWANLLGPCFKYCSRWRSSLPSFHKNGRNKFFTHCCRILTSRDICTVYNCNIQ